MGNSWEREIVGWSNTQRRSLELPHDGKEQKGEAIKEMTACVLGSPASTRLIVQSKPTCQRLWGWAMAGEDTEMEMSPYQDTGRPCGEQQDALGDGERAEASNSLSWAHSFLGCS